MEGEINQIQTSLLLLKGEAQSLEREIELSQNQLKKINSLKGQLKKTLEEEKRKLSRLLEGIEETNRTLSNLLKERRELLKREEEIRQKLSLLEENLEKEKEEKSRLLLELSRLEEKLNSLFGEGEEIPLSGETLEELKRKLLSVERELSSLGSVNFRADREYGEVLQRYREYKEKYTTLLREKRAIKEFIAEMERHKERIFLETFRQINRNLKEIFSFLSPGGQARMELEKPQDIFNGGINMVVKPRGKEVKYLEAMSGGEKTLAALSLIFALQRYKPAPFYYFDEVDAHLDEANALKVGELIKRYSREAQFIVVTLRESVAYLADRLIGVTARGGVSEVYILDPSTLKGE